MIKEIGSIKYFDEESDSEAYIFVRKYKDAHVALSISIKGNGDIDTLMTKKTAKELSDVLLLAIEE